MKSLAEVERRLGEVIEEISLGRVSAANIELDQALMAELGLDSLDYAQVMLACESWLQVKVREKDVDWRKVVSVRDLAVLLFETQSQ